MYVSRRTPSLLPRILCSYQVYCVYQSLVLSRTQDIKLGIRIKFRFPKGTKSNPVIPKNPGIRAKSESNRARFLKWKESETSNLQKMGIRFKWIDSTKCCNQSGIRSRIQVWLIRQSIWIRILIPGIYANSAIHTDSNSAIHADSDSAIHPDSDSRIDSDAAINCVSDSSIHRDSYSGMHSDFDSGLYSDSIWFWFPIPSTGNWESESKVDWFPKVEESEQIRISNHGKSYSRIRIRRWEIKETTSATASIR